MPKLYGDEVRDLGQVTDWKSGMAVAGKSFGIGMYEGLTDIFVQPVKGAREGGALGASAGLGRGVMNMAFKTSAATLGLMAYPSKGIAKSIDAVVRTGTRNSIIAAKMTESVWLAGRGSGARLDRMSVTTLFDILRKGKAKGFTRKGKT